MNWGRSDPLASVTQVMGRLDTDLKSGKFDRLSQHFTQLERAISSLPNMKLDAAARRRLDRIKSTAAHHGRLIQAVLRGMRDVQDRHQAKPGFSSYTAQGSTDHIGRSGPRFEHRS